jgi:DNA-binding NarL/FixJ family response regulator
MISLGAIEDLTMARLQDNPPPPVRLFLVDDEPMVRRGLRLLLGVKPGLAVCGETDNEHDALQGILALQPDLAVVDLTLKIGDGLTLIKQLHQFCPALKILVFSMHDQAHFAASAFAAGAHGYVLKEEGTERVLDAVRMVMQGQRYLSQRIAAKAPGLVPRTGPRGRARKL